MDMKRKWIIAVCALLLSVALQAQTPLKKVYDEMLNPMEQIDTAQE